MVNRDADRRWALHRGRRPDRLGTGTCLARSPTTQRSASTSRTRSGGWYRLQPASLLVCLVSTVAFAVSASGTPRTLAGLAVSCFLAVLAGSGAGLVPFQRRLVDPRSDLSAADVERLRTRWLRGHLIRTVVALAAFVLLVVAAVA